MIDRVLGAVLMMILASTAVEAVSPETAIRNCFAALTDAAAQSGEAWTPEALPGTQLIRSPRGDRGDAVICQTENTPGFSVSDDLSMADGGAYLAAYKAWAQQRVRAGARIISDTLEAGPELMDCTLSRGTLLAGFWGVPPVVMTLEPVRHPECATLGSIGPLPSANAPQTA